MIAGEEIYRLRVWPADFPNIIGTGQKNKYRYLPIFFLGNKTKKWEEEIIGRRGEGLTSSIPLLLSLIQSSPMRACVDAYNAVFVVTLRLRRGSPETSSQGDDGARRDVGGDERQRSIIVLDDEKRERRRREIVVVA